MSLDPAEASFYAHYFVDPEVGDGVLRPERAGVACRNIRTALGMLGYELPYGDRYDEELARTVLRFQTDCGHAARDGFVGPGTRVLLARQLLEKFHPDIFRRLEAPVSGLVFVSYRREDMERIEPYVDALQRWGFQVWYDKDIPGGAAWMVTLEEKVAECDLVMVFLSRAASESKWVDREVAFADELNKPTLAIRLDPGDLARGWGVRFSSSQILDSSEPEFLPQLKRAVDHIVRDARRSDSS